MMSGTDGVLYTNCTSSIFISSNTTNTTNYYGSTNIGCFICNTNVGSFTNTGIILSGGGSNGGTAGTNAFTNNAGITITNFINRTGAFLGGGGGGANGGWTSLDGGKGGPGGPGGGGGGSGGNGGTYKNGKGATGGSIIANVVNGSIGGGGGGGGPGGNGSAGNGNTYSPGGTGGGSPGANGAFYTINTAGQYIYTPSSNTCNINIFKYGGGGGGYGQGESYLSSGGGGYGGGYGSGWNKSNYIPYGGGGGGGGGYGSGHPWTAGNGGYSVCNNGIITNFINGQGGTKVANYIYGPVFFYGNAPQNYSIYIQSADRYGQLFCTGWAGTSGKIIFSVDKNSTINTTTVLQYVLVGITPNDANLQPTRIKATNGIIIWNLTYVPANSSIFGVYAYHLNINVTAFQPYNIANSISTLYNSDYHHIALSILGNIHKLYFDGNIVATNTNALDVFKYYPSIISNMYIGSAADLSYGFTGYIDDFRLFNSGLSASEISNIYTNSPIIPTITDLKTTNITDTSISVLFTKPTSTSNYSYQVKISPSASITTSSRSSGNVIYLTNSGFVSNTLYQMYIIATNISTGTLNYSNAISFTTNSASVAYKFANNLNTSSNVSVSYYGEYTILTFLNTDSITFTSLKNVPIGYIVVGGGGGAGWINGGLVEQGGTGGGGGGGVAYVNSYLNSNLTCNINITYNINIGTGGLSGNWLRSSTDGNPSYIQDSVTSTKLVNANGGNRSFSQRSAGTGGTSSGGIINLTGGTGGALQGGSTISSIVSIPNIGLSKYYGGGGAGSFTGSFSAGAGGGGNYASPGTTNTGGGGGGQASYLQEKDCNGYGGSGVVILYFSTYN